MNLIPSKICLSRINSRIGLLPLRLYASSVINCGNLRHFAPRGNYGSNFPKTRPLDDDEENEGNQKKQDGVLAKTPLFGRKLRNENLRKAMPEIVLDSPDHAQDDINSMMEVKSQQEELQLDEKSIELDDKLTYGQEYYILNRDKLLQQRYEKEQEAKFGDYSARLVKRPKKDFMWGYGTQMHEDARDEDEETCFTHGQLPTIKELINFLEIYQMKDLKVVNLKALGKQQEKYAIVSTGFSVRHVYATAKILIQKLKALDCPDIVNLPRISGTKEDSWCIVCVKEIQVHLVIEEYRNELDLEFRWLNPPPPEMKKKWDIYAKLKRRGQSLNVNEDTFKIENQDEADRYR